MTKQYHYFISLQVMTKHTESGISMQLAGRAIGMDGTAQGEPAQSGDRTGCECGEHRCKRPAQEGSVGKNSERAAQAKEKKHLEKEKGPSAAQARPR